MHSPLLAMNVGSIFQQLRLLLCSIASEHVGVDIVDVVMKIDKKKYLDNE